MAETTQTMPKQTTVEELDELRISPAAHLADEMAAASEAGGRAVGLREHRFAVQLGLRCRPASASGQALEDALGIDLPRAVGEVTGDAAGLHALWLGPDEFLAVDVSRAQQPGDSLVAEAALEGLPGQAVDLSANRTILELTGSKAREVLEKSCRADLHPRAFGVGSAIVTQLGPVPVILQHSADLEYRVFPRASFADFTVRWLLDGMAEFITESSG
ncbi:sarcosine oxidase subunit gamma [Brevibacterium zhoupengii]|uniref:sarcosine oxidase subunit gamma n=1 Tax=Brevibacterium zhoupengii TaxID=2898795 RepID=UPI001E46E619|nr:sarcosine oxidase subunit gamma family protein [Brevibacterium zhoupengii]